MVYPTTHIALSTFRFVCQQLDKLFKKKFLVAVRFIAKTQHSFSILSKSLHLLMISILLMAVAEDILENINGASR